MEQLDAVESYLRGLQDRICAALAQADGQAFATDEWTRADHLRGRGRSRILKDGALFEQAGVGFSDVGGDTLPAAATALRPELAGARWRALGVSLVVHPRNPHVPTSHANVRYFEAQPPEGDPVWWFGGGFDLTPFYPVAEDVRHWHGTARALRWLRSAALRRAQGLVRPLFPPEAPRGGAWGRRPVLRRSQRRRLRAQLRLPARGRRRVP